MDTTLSKPAKSAPQNTFLTCQILSAELEAVLTGHTGGEFKVVSFCGLCDNPSFHLDGSTNWITNQAEGDMISMGGTCVQELLPAPMSTGADPSIGQCFELFLNKNLIEYYTRQGAYLLTPGWLIDWENRLSTWEFDRSTAIQFFDESCKYLLMLDTGVYPGSTQLLQQLADYIQRPFEILPVGLDVFRLRIEHKLAATKLESDLTTAQSDISRLHKELGNYAMAMDVIQQLTQCRQEQEVVGLILSLFTMLFAPQQLYYLAFKDDETTVLYHQNGTALDAPGVKDRLRSQTENYHWHDGKKGFTIKVIWSSNTLGVIEVSEIQFPQHGDHYLNLALSLSHICGLAIHNVQVYELEVYQRQVLEKRNNQIQDLLDEKETLLQEIHHRIKNNMNTISALLSLHALETEEPAAAVALQDAQSRVYSMMVLYDQLFISGGFQELALDRYLGEMIEKGVGIFPNSKSVDLDIRLDDVIMPVKRMMNLGIMVNEVLTNAMKYAFNQQEKGLIKVRSQVNQNQLKIVIQDNGIGLPESVDPHNYEGFGMNLIRSSARALGGSVNIESQNGTSTTIELPIVLEY